jgi:class 3 adenylate cyclase
MPSKGAEGTSELRQVTALFCDLVESTPLLSDPDYDVILQDYHVVCTRIVEEQFGGRVQDRFGDGFLVYFGFPTVIEQKEQRAVRAALALMTAIGRLRTSSGQLRARIGISNGSVVAKQVGAQVLPVGEAPALAARMLSEAVPGAVLISESTMRLVEPYFDVRNVGTRLPKGFTRITEVYEVLRERATGSRLEMLRAGRLTPLVGREAETQNLLLTWEAVKAQKQRHVSLICGEPGIGKSRLVIALQQYAESDPDSWLITCSASPFYQNTAFYPIVDLLQRHVLGFESSDSDTERFEKLKRWLAQFDRRETEGGFDVELALPLFARLLSIGPDATGPSDNPLADKQRTMRALLHVLRLRASQRSVLFICEDVHWADASTRELLSQLIDMEPSRPLLVVLTFRPEFDSSGWIGREGIAQMTLARLEAADSAELARQASDKDLSPALLNQIVVRAGGVPLFLEELGRAATDAGIPASLWDSLMSRLDRLDQHGGRAKAVAQIASVLGREFSFDLLHAAATGIPADTLETALERLLQDQVLYLLALEPERRYVFKHALIQQAAYEAIVPRDQIRLHRQVAEILVSRFAETASKEPELVALHYTEGGRPLEALEYWIRAGDHALVRAANVEAITHLERARRIVLAEMEDGPERDGRELDVQRRLAPAYMAIKGWASEHVEVTCRRVLDLTAPIGDFGALWGLWTNHFLRSRMHEALDVGRQLLHSAEQMMRGGTDENRVMMTNFAIMAHHALGYSHFYRGEFADSRRIAEAGLALRQDRSTGAFAIDAERELVRSLQFSSSAALRMMLGCSLWMLGQPSRGRSLVADSIALTRELDHFPSEAYALASSLLLHHCDLDVAATTVAAGRLRALAQQERFEIWTPFADMFDGWVMAEDGQGGDGVAKARRGLDEWRSTGSVLNQTIVNAMLARSLRRSGSIDEALSVLDAEIDDAGTRHELLFAPELYRLKGEILAERGEVVDGVAALRQAEDLANLQGARMLVLRSLLSQFRLAPAADRADIVSRLADVVTTLGHDTTIPDVCEAIDRMAAYRKVVTTSE